MSFLAADGRLDTECWHSQGRRLDVSVQFVLARRLGGEAGEDTAQQEAAGRMEAWSRTHSSPPSSHGPAPTMNAHSSCSRPPPWVSFTCSLACCSSLRPGQSQCCTYEKPFLILINFQICNINLAVMAVGAWSCPGRMEMHF